MRQEGYSLFETAIVLSLIAIVSASYLQLKTFSVEGANIVKINDQLNEIQMAIDAYASLKGYLPCPARLDAAKDTANYGAATDCSAAAVSGVKDIGSGTDVVRTGALPTKELNLSPSMMIDPWGNRISYTVIKSLGTSKTNYDAYTSSSSYVLRINDSAGNMINTTNASATKKEVVAYVLVSHGQDKRGAYNENGTQVVACGSVLDSENCDLDAIFIDTGYNSVAATSYDDFVRWKSLQQITFDKVVYRYSTTSAGTNCEAIFNPSTFAPTDLSDLILWLDANDATTLFSNSSCTTQSGYSDVLCWKDKSPTAAYAVNSSGNNFPDSRLDGKKTVRFNGDEWLKIPKTGAMLDLYSVEVFLVMKVLSVQDGFVFYNNSNDQLSLKLPNSSSNAVWIFDEANSGAAWGGNTSAFKIWNMIGEGDLTNSLYRGQTPVYSISSGAAYITVGANDFMIGCKNTALANCIKSEISELLIYKRKLTVNERSKVTAYLKKKWNL